MKFMFCLGLYIGLILGMLVSIVIVYLSLKNEKE